MKMKQEFCVCISSTKEAKAQNSREEVFLYTAFVGKRSKTATCRGKDALKSLRKISDMSVGKEELLAVLWGREVAYYDF